MVNIKKLKARVARLIKKGQTKKAKILKETIEAYEKSKITSDMLNRIINELFSL